MSKNVPKSHSTCNCIICGSPTKPLYDPQFKVTYDVCQMCDFIYKNPQDHLAIEDEKSRYLEHNNTEESGYKEYMKRFVEAHITNLEDVKTIFDFGSGPYHMLKVVLEEYGYIVDDYDPFFNPDMTYKDKMYDAIVSTEVLEHISNPLETLKNLVTHINKCGYLIIRTEFRTENLDRFLKWYYRRDMTHIGFYNYNTFEYIAKVLNLNILTTNHKNTIIFRKVT